MRSLGRSRVVFVAAVVVAAAGVALGPANAALGGRLGAGSAPEGTVATALAPDAKPVLARLSGLARLATAPASSAETLLGVATFAAPPTDGQVDALTGLGLRAQGLRNLPMALVAGTEAQLRAAVSGGVARDVYPNEVLEWNSDESVAAIGADAVHAAGVTGAGVGVAIVDSGVDATHPALADHVTHNVKIISPEYISMLGIPIDPEIAANHIAIPVDAGPYNNSDSLSGHGTHVAGIVAGDGTGTPEVLGVAPDAEIIGYSTGDVALVITVIAAYDHIVEHAAEWNIDVVNNSWGSSFRVFDPNDPINVATKAAHDAGLVVAFSAGNDTEDGTVNPYSVAPWVISVGAATVTAQRSDFSSGGLRFDNSMGDPLPSDKHVHFDGDRVGIYHPDVSAPGTDIVSAGTPTGVYVGPTLPGGTATASGTSMSSPHVAGLAALLLEAKPTLTPIQVREVLQVTARPMADGSPFWQSGYGFVDAPAAVDLVQASDFSGETLQLLQREADARVLGDRDHRVRASDLWLFTALPVTVAGLDSRTYTVPVDEDTTAVTGTVAFPTTPLIGANLFEYSLTVYDAAGAEVATTEVSDTAGVGHFFVELSDLDTPPEFGDWTVQVAGLLGASDTNLLLGNAVSVHFAQLEPQERQGGGGPRFTPGGSLPLYFAGGAGALPSPEGCGLAAGAPVGTLAESPPADTTCQSGVVGYSTSYAADTPAVFTSAPLTSDVTIGGTGSLRVYLVDPAQPVYSVALGSALSYELSAVAADGTVTPLAEDEAEELVQAGPTPTASTFTVSVPPMTVPAGSALRLTLRFSGVYTAAMRMVYAGTYADSGLTLTTGTIA